MYVIIIADEYFLSGIKFRIWLIDVHHYSLLPFNLNSIWIQVKLKLNKNKTIIIKSITLLNLNHLYFYVHVDSCMKIIYIHGLIVIWILFLILTSRCQFCVHTIIWILGQWQFIFNSYSCFSNCFDVSKYCWKMPTRF